eukprot:3189844-Pyramimonas_sp.AAC.2
MSVVLTKPPAGTWPRRCSRCTPAGRRPSCRAPRRRACSSGFPRTSSGGPPPCRPAAQHRTAQDGNCTVPVTDCDCDCDCDYYTCWRSGSTGS